MTYEPPSFDTGRTFDSRPSGVGRAQYQTPLASQPAFIPPTSHLESDVVNHHHPINSNTNPFMTAAQNFTGMMSAATGLDGNVDTGQDASKAKIKASVRRPSVLTPKATPKATPKPKKTKDASGGPGMGLAMPSDGTVSDMEVVCPLPNKHTGQACNKKCSGEKRFRSIQEHIRRAHPQYYLKLPATEDSFRLMISTPPHVVPQGSQDSKPTSSSASGPPVTSPTLTVKQNSVQREEVYSPQQAHTAKLDSIYPAQDNNGPSEMDLSPFAARPFPAPFTGLDDTFTHGTFSPIPLGDQAIGAPYQNSHLNLPGSNMNKFSSPARIEPSTFFDDQFAPGPDPAAYDASALDPGLAMGFEDTPMENAFHDLSGTSNNYLTDIALLERADSFGGVPDNLGGQNFSMTPENEHRHSASDSPGITMASSIDHSSPETPVDTTGSHPGLEALATAAASRATDLSSETGTSRSYTSINVPKTVGAPFAPSFLSAFEKYNNFPNLRSFESAVTNPKPPRIDYSKQDEASKVENADRPASTTGYSPCDTNGFGDAGSNDHEDHSNRISQTSEVNHMQYEGSREGPFQANDASRFQHDASHEGVIIQHEVNREDAATPKAANTPKANAADPALPTTPACSNQDTIMTDGDEHMLEAGDDQRSPTGNVHGTGDPDLVNGSRATDVPQGIKNNHPAPALSANPTIPTNPNAHQQPGPTNNASTAETNAAPVLPYYIGAVLQRPSNPAQSQNTSTSTNVITFDTVTNDATSLQQTGPEPGTQVYQYVCAKLAFLTRKTRLNRTRGLGGYEAELAQQAENVEMLRYRAIHAWHELNDYGFKHDEGALGYLIAA